MSRIRTNLTRVEWWVAVIVCAVVGESAARIFGLDRGFFITMWSAAFGTLIVGDKPR